MSVSTPSRLAVAQEPVFVFGANIAGDHKEGPAAVAARFHGGEAGKWNGPAGNCYAVPYLDSRMRLLPLDVIGNYVSMCCEYIAKRPALQFQIMRFACEPGEYTDAQMSDLWRHAPENCQLPGVWLRTLDPRRAVRLLVFDPGEALAEPSRQALMERFLAEKAAQCGTAQVEFVSIGSLPGIGATAQFARRLNRRHRVIGQNTAFYGDDAALTCERKAVWYATHLVDLFEVENTGRPEHMRVLGSARRGGLVVDELIG
jgi:hypothetical protein